MNDLAVKAWQYEKQAALLIKKLKARNFGAHYAPTADEGKKLVLSLLPAEGEIAIAGSQTLEQIGVCDALRSGVRKLFDPAKQNQDLPLDERLKSCKKTLLADILLCSTNAIDADGRLYNIDGIGNRVAAMMFGPSKVILAVGMNKLARNPEEAWQRARQIASPMNNKRLSRPNPCAESGLCHDCSKDSRICNYFTIIERSREPERIEIVLIGADLGY